MLKLIKAGIYTVGAFYTTLFITTFIEEFRK